MKKKILNIALILMLIISLFVLTACGENSEEEEKTVKPEDEAVKVVEDFYDYAVELDYKSMFELIDFAGMSVYQEIEDDGLDEFKVKYEEYIESEEWKEMEEQVDSLVDSMVSMMESSEDEETIGTTEILSTEVEEISEDLYKVDAEIKTVDSDGEETIENLAHYVFKSGDEYKIVYADGM